MMRLPRFEDADTRPIATQSAVRRDIRTRGRRPGLDRRPIDDMTLSRVGDLPAIFCRDAFHHSSLLADRAGCRRELA